MTDLDLFKSEWKFTRGLTLELLDSLTDAELGETPGPGLGPFWKQFRHVGRLQECYQEALNSRALDRELVQAVERVDWNATIEWEGEMASVFQHLMRMLAHETLHHGQWIIYARLTGKTLPPGWKAWGA